MRLLLDTHILLWALTRSERMSRKGWELLEDEHNFLIVSAVSVWEIAIKHGRGHGYGDVMPMSGKQALAEIRAADFDLLAISHEHSAAVDGLPLHHRDPFDRLLVAQSRYESMHLLTHDSKLADYGDLVIVI